MRMLKPCLFIAWGFLGVARLASASSGPSCGTLDDEIFVRDTSVCALPSAVDPFEAPSCSEGRTMLTRCFCKAPQRTPTFTGTGPNCTQANANIYYQGDAWINSSPHCVNTDGICYESAPIVTVACFFNSTTGLYQESGYLVFKCLFCE
jgi:hypothetical protein